MNPHNIRKHEFVPCVENLDLHWMDAAAFGGRFQYDFLEVF